MLAVSFSVFLLYSLDPHLCLILYFLSLLSLQTDDVPLSFGAAFNQTYYLSLPHIYILNIYIFFCRSMIVFMTNIHSHFNTNLEGFLCVYLQFILFYLVSLFKCWMIFTSNLNISLQILKSANQRPL